MKKQFFSVLAALCIYFCATAQQAVITGRITDAITGKPLAGVMVFSQANNKAFITAYKGRYSIVLAKAGVLRFSKAGYVRANIYVQPAAAHLPVKLVPLNTPPAGEKKQPANIQPLKIGSRFNLLPAYRGKALIIDFFATYCSPCIRLLPLLDSLQQVHSDSLRVLVVTGEAPAKLAAFMQQHPAMQRLKLTMLAGDTLLHKAFPHSGVPHEVWLGSDGKVKAITNERWLSPANIAALLQGRPLALPVKEAMVPFNKAMPLAVQAGNTTVYGSTITGRLNMPNNITGIVKDSTGLRMYAINMGAMALYQYAYGRILAANRVALELKDNTRFIEPISPSPLWTDTTTWCYEIKAPLATSIETLHQRMQQDLDRFFNLQSRIEKRKLSCWVLQLTDSSLLHTTGGKPADNLWKEEATTRSMKNQPLSRLVAAMNLQYAGRPLCPVVLDETGFTGRADMELPLSSVQDLPAMQQLLPRYGLRLVTQQREPDMLVLADKHN